MCSINKLINILKIILLVFRHIFFAPATVVKKNKQSLIICDNCFCLDVLDHSVVFILLFLLVVFSEVFFCKYNQLFKPPLSYSKYIVLFLDAINIIKLGI